MSERTTACWICLGETLPNTPDGRYHHACLEALFGVSNTPAIPFDQLTVTTWAEEHDGRMSISGYQPKGPAALDETGTQFLLVEKNSTHIVKPPHPQYHHIIENEHLTMRLARLVGLDVAEHGLIELSDGAIAYVTKRFDRPNGARGAKRHAIDFCQLTDRDPDDKYSGSIAECAAAALKYGGVATACALFRQFIFSDWVRNGDLHLKNLMLLETDDGGWALSPAYDLVCTAMYNVEGFKLFVDGEPKNLSRKFWLLFAETHCGLSANDAERLLDAMLGRLDDAKALVDRSAFPKVEWKHKYKHLLEKKTRHLAGIV